MRNAEYPDHCTTLRADLTSGMTTLPVWMRRMLRPLELSEAQRRK